MFTPLKHGTLLSMHTKLQTLGLSERESRVYYATLRIGKATVEQIAREAGIVRTTTYTQIDTLMKAGLMSSFTEGKKTYYIAEAPDNLTRLIEKQRQKIDKSESLLSSLLPELSSLYSKNASKPIVRFFPGKEGLITMRNEILEMENKEMLVVTSYDDFITVFNNPEERMAFSRKRADKGIKSCVLYTTKEEPTGLLGDQKFKQIDNEEFPLEFDIYIYDNKVAISSFKDDIWGIVIESKAVSTSMRSMFKIAWKYIPHNKK